jgi:hypothetical protein
MLFDLFFAKIKPPPMNSSYNWRGISGKSRRAISRQDIVFLRIFKAKSFKSLGVYKDVKCNTNDVG